MKRSGKFAVREFRTNFRPREDFAASRNELRKIVVNEFLAERPGTGREEKASRYRYNVEELRDGRKIYLLRPATLKGMHGFDFEIWMERWSNSEDKRPGHEDILSDLRQKRRKMPEKYRKLHEAMLNVYACKEPDDVIHDFSGLEFECGLDVEIVLKLIKWFFIEQDIRYWNYSGRGMFKEALNEIFTRTELTF